MGTSFEHLTWASISAQWVWKVLVAAFLFVFGAHLAVLPVVFGLMCARAFTAIVLAAHQSQLCPSDFFKFPIRLTIFLTMLGVAMLVDMSIPPPIPAAATPLMVSFLAFAEALGTLQNCQKLGFPVPDKLVKMLKTAQQAPNIQAQENEK